MFRASLICLSKDIIKQSNSVIYKFIWKGTDKVKRFAIISDYKNGGLRMSHIEALNDTLRIMCLKKYSQDYISPWKHILSFLLKDYGGKFLMHCRFTALLIYLAIFQISIKSVSQSAQLGHRPPALRPSISKSATFKKM